MGCALSFGACAKRNSENFDCHETCSDRITEKYFVMSEKIYRFNGRFAKRKVILKKQKALTAMSAAKKKYVSEVTCENNTLEGLRIVHINELANNLVCNTCRKDLYLKQISEEIRSGLHSKFKIMCSECKMMNIVNSGRITKINNKSYPETNISMALGQSFSDIFIVRNTSHNFLNLYIRCCT